MTVDPSDYELVWPTELFVSEGKRLIANPTAPSWLDRVEWLLTEALAGTTAVADFRDALNVSRKESWGRRPPQNPLATPEEEWFAELVRHAGELRHATTPRPYWPQRRGQSLPDRKPEDVRLEFNRVINVFLENGYLVEVFGESCVDRDEELPEPSKVIESRLGIPNLWPLKPESWDEGTLYGLIEVFHDLVSRPRRRDYHSFSSCGYHHYDFHSGPARILYRVRVNEMLRRSGIVYELANEGEDRGRLVTSTDDARSNLIEKSLRVSERGVQERTEHAIALFRGRNTSQESKRSAIVALAGLLEERRDLIKTEMVSADEGALFKIANKFNLRHRDARQHTDYDDNFLDWIFWWYLATVELTNRILADRSLPSQSAPSDGGPSSDSRHGTTPTNQ